MAAWLWGEIVGEWEDFMVIFPLLQRLSGLIRSEYRRRRLVRNGLEIMNLRHLCTTDRRVWGRAVDLCIPSIFVSMHLVLSPRKIVLNEKEGTVDRTLRNSSI